MDERISGVQVVRQSQIKPDVLQRFIAGYIRENADREPYRYTDELGQIYPNFKDWFRNKVEPGLHSNRELILLMDGEQASVVGFAILKKTLEEKKICTFRISDGWRNSGAGNMLMRECFDYLETEKPLITVSDKCKKSFEKIFSQFGFKQMQAIPDLYVAGSTEYVFNGKIKV